MHVVLSTCSPADARGIARRLVEERLAACCNAVPGVESTYWWEGEVQTDSETLLIFKTPGDRVAALMARLEELHPYDVPEMLALPVEAGFEPYIAWVEREGRPV
jgi:periplasmic divalent cation tolerance protein